MNHNYEDHLPLIVNKDKLCPLRKKAMEKYNLKTEIIEVDSLDNILRMVENGRGISLLPISLQINRNIKQVKSEKLFINYYEYSMK